MKKLILSLVAISACTFIASAKTPETNTKAIEKNLIKSMAGMYKVDFKFAETFASDTTYDYSVSKKKFEWGYEYVQVIEETDNKISLQHILIVNDTILVKHWRQDWVYENNVLFEYQQDNTWKKRTLKPEDVKGTWTQKVFQVDDSPRYEGYGTWVHSDGRHYWESKADAPLPRREMTIRRDYNVLQRTSHIELFKDGSWVLDQDNAKVVREKANDKIICWEKGVEFMHPTDRSPQPAIKWWTNNQQFWKDVRGAWDEVFAKNPSFTLKNKIESKRLYDALFELGAKYEGSKSYNSKEAKLQIQKIITDYMVVNS